MIAELKVYGSCSSLEPTKVYTVYRMTPHTMGLVQDFIVKKFGGEIPDAKKYATEDEAASDMERFLQILFPTITKEEIYMLDFGDGTGNNGQFYEFVKAIADYGNAESSRASKN